MGWIQVATLLHVISITLMQGSARNSLPPSSISTASSDVSAADTRDQQTSVDARRSWQTFVRASQQERSHRRNERRRRTRLTNQSQHGSNESLADKSHEGSTHGLSGHAVTSVAFAWSLPDNVQVGPRSLTHVWLFHKMTGPGSFSAAAGLVDGAGKFKSPQSGVYFFSVTVHITPYNGLRHHSYNRVKRHKRNDHVRLLVCIQSLCQKNRSLDFIASLESDAKVFSINFSGLLYLESGQYASVFTENSSSRPLTILSGSIFSGYLAAT